MSWLSKVFANRRQSGDDAALGADPQCGSQGAVMRYRVARNLTYGLALAGALAATVVSASAENLPELAYLEGVRNAEDIEALPGTPYLLAGQLIGRHADVLGGFYLVNAVDRAAKLFAPDFSAAPLARYAACEGPPAADRFAAHGLSVRSLGDARFHVLAINHGGRESIESFELNLSGASPRMIWQGCVAAPPTMSANAVAHLGADMVIATSFGVRGDPDLLSKLSGGDVTGFAAVWRPRRGWQPIAGSELRGTNGVAVARNGRQLYLADWGGSAIRVLRAGDFRVLRDIALPDMRPDNIKLAADGSLLVAGQLAAPADVIGCAKLRPAPCLLPYRIVRVSPDTGKVASLFEVASPTKFGAASGAAIHHGRLWIGSFQADGIAHIAVNGDRP